MKLIDVFTMCRTKGHFALIIFSIGCQMNDDFALVLDRDELCELNSLIPVSIIYDRISYNSQKAIFSCYHTPLSVVLSDTSECVFPSQKFLDQQSYGFYLFNVPEKSKKRLFGVQIQSPRWSPDGKWLVWSNNDDIFKMPLINDTLDYSQVKRLTQDSVLLTNPKWSPSGQSILVYADLIDKGVNFKSKGWYVMSSEGVNPIYQMIDETETVWLDDNSLLFLSENRFFTKKLHTAGFTEISSLPDSLAQIRSVKYDPSTKSIYFIARPKQGDFYRLYSFQLSSKKFTPLLNVNILEFDIIDENSLVLLVNINQISVVQKYDKVLDSVTPLFSFDIQ